MVGRTISHYRVLEEVGRGGMGVVYKAEDTRLGRLVALKFLPEDLIRHPHSFERFQREARMTSALNNPHICVIYEIDEVEGRPFIAMEFLEGRNLKQLICARPLQNDEIVELGIQIADALEAAHSRGVIHRDIKPANIFITSQGRAKVLDFGLAKLATTREKASVASAGVSETSTTADPTSDTSITGQEVAIGTAAYMSPEQARGEQLDPRTDIFSFGTVLYEMATARRAFPGATSAIIFDAILNHEPPPLSRLNFKLPPGLIDIIHRALEKDREIRYQTASDLRADLKRLKRDLDSGTGSDSESLTPPALARARAHATSATPLRIAVLPFASATGDPEAEYLCEGIADSLIDNLSQLPNLRVISRSSAFRYKGMDTDPQTLGRELNAGAVLLGRITKHGNELAISVELVDAVDNSHIWGQRYNQQVSDMLFVQEEIADAIASKLRLKFTGKEKKRLRRPTENPQAYEFYLKGRYWWNKRTIEGLQKAITYFEQAIEEDPGYARAYAGLGDCHAMLGWNSMVSPKQCLPKAIAAASKAVELDENLAEAHASLGLAKLCHGWAWAEAEKEFKTASRLNPAYPAAHQWYAFELAALGKFDDALEEAKTALRLDPLSLSINISAGFIYYLAQRYEPAIEYAQKALEMDAGFGQAHFVLGCVYDSMKLYSEAVAELQTAAQLTRNNPAMLASLGRAQALAGHTDEAEALIEQLKEQSKLSYVPPYNLAIIYAALRQKEKAFEYLEKSFEERSIWLIFLKTFAAFSELREEPAFVNLLRRLCLAS